MYNHTTNILQCLWCCIYSSESFPVSLAMLSNYPPTVFPQLVSDCFGVEIQPAQHEKRFCFLLFLGTK